MDIHYPQNDDGLNQDGQSNCFGRNRNADEKILPTFASPLSDVSPPLTQ
jgi:hypothetical protein